MHYSPTFGGFNDSLPTYSANDGVSRTNEEWGNIVLSKVLNIIETFLVKNLK